MRQPITITNTDKAGRVTNKWFVRIGKRWRVFGPQDWAKNGIDWIQQALAAGIGVSGKTPENQKAGQITEGKNEFGSRK